VLRGNNFQDTYRPNALTLPSGMGKQFQADVKALVEEATRGIRSAFESEEYAVRREETGQAVARRRNELFVQLDQKARQEGFIIQNSRWA